MTTQTFPTAATLGWHQAFAIMVNAGVPRPRAHAALDRATRTAYTDDSLIDLALTTAWHHRTRGYTVTTAADADVALGLLRNRERKTTRRAVTA